MLMDPYGRQVNSLRLSVTQKCNLNCSYCHREGQEESEIEMSPGEIYKIFSIAAELGVKKVKITGGEPLIRDDIVEVVEKIKKAGASEISLITNGALLHKYAKELKQAGLDRVNVSCDYPYHVGTGKSVDKVKKGIMAARDAGLEPIKINMVVQRENQNDVWEMFEFAKDNGAVLQLIELIDTGKGGYFQRNFYDLKVIEDKLVKNGAHYFERSLHGRRVYYYENGKIEFVRSMHNTSFCSKCTRMRVTSDGKLKPCIMRNDNLIDILTPMRKRKNKKELKEIFLKAVDERKPYWLSG